MLNRKQILPFAGAGAAWILLSALICWKTAPSWTEFLMAAKWLSLLSGIALFDLLAIAKVVSNLFEIQSLEGAALAEKRTFLIIQTSYWGAIKIACILLFGIILVKGSHLPSGIPTTGLITGIATFVVVPLVGGIGWYLREARIMS